MILLRTSVRFTPVLTRQLVMNYNPYCSQNSESRVAIQLTSSPVTQHNFTYRLSKYIFDSWTFCLGKSKQHVVNLIQFICTVSPSPYVELLTFFEMHIVKMTFSRASVILKQKQLCMILNILNISQISDPTMFSVESYLKTENNTQFAENGYKA